jgi:hypothetical protein
MIIFPSGLLVTQTEYKCMQHIEENPEQALRNTWDENVILYRDKMIDRWHPALLEDSNVIEMPAEFEALAALILGRSDYKTRSQRNVDRSDLPSFEAFNTARYDAVDRSGTTTTLFENGVDLSSTSVSYILDRHEDIDDLFHGAILGFINKGKKKMLAQYHPIIMDDASVTTMPATEDGLITMILARSDYQRLGS